MRIFPTYQYRTLVYDYCTGTVLENLVNAMVVIIYSPSHSYLAGEWKSLDSNIHPYPASIMKFL